jgi:hypothetical protein
MKFTKITSIAAIVAALGAAPAMAQDVGMWDGNSDGALSTNEFATGFSDRGIFDTWDQDKDGLLSDTEFSDGVYGTYDANVSGDIDEIEYGVYDDRRTAAGY